MFRRRFLTMLLLLLGVAGLAWWTSGQRSLIPGQILGGGGGGSFWTSLTSGAGAAWSRIFGGGDGGLGAASAPAGGRCSGEAEGAAIGGPFSLVDQTGARVTDKTLTGQPLLIYFGFTFCPDVCPVGLDRMSEATEILEAAGRKVTPVFITVDPERDTIPVMAAYTQHFHPRMIGLTGDLQEIDAAAQAYKVYYGKRPDPDFADGYTMDHTGFTYFVDAQGRFRSFFRNGATAQEIADGAACQMARG
ncbi:SCO family protein [Neomegalonema sp.]|uniref:SCO family protein n=1 Tax=Neomegalonema sp. TaxID=2039713 RepID=UPI002623FA1B|nr:SCO family protein [Neomegalonema sp.]MDD2868452.1 SCO family protein [Neomegalonema sp.]